MKSGEVMNWIDGRVVGKRNELTKVEAGNSDLLIVNELESGEVSLGLRPEDITLFSSNESFEKISALNRLKGKIKGFEDYDNYNLVKIDCGDFSLKVAITDTSIEKMDLSKEKEVYATFKATAPEVKK